MRVGDEGERGEVEKCGAKVRERIRGAGDIPKGIQPDIASRITSYLFLRIHKKLCSYVKKKKKGRIEK